MSTLRLTTISNQGGTASVPSDTVINGTAKAWAIWNGSSLAGSFNVSSVTDSGSGNYIVNFTNSLPDANYAVGYMGEAGRFNSRSASSLSLQRILDNGVGSAGTFSVAIFR